MLEHDWQIALKWDTAVLYAQQLVGDGYEFECPFDLSIADSDTSECIAQETVEGTHYVHADGTEIDWKGIIGHAREYELGGNVLASPFNWFFVNFDECLVLDPDAVADDFSTAGIL